MSPTSRPGSSQGLAVVASDARSLAAAPAGALRIALGPVDELPEDAVHRADRADTSAWAALWARRRTSGDPVRQVVFLVD